MSYITARFRNEKYKYIHKILGILPFVVLLISMLILHRFEKMQIGDDQWYKQIPPNYTFFNYVKWRYFDWSARISAESVLYFIFRDDGYLWKFINPVIITLFAYGINRIVVGNKMFKNNRHIILSWYICIGWLFMSNAVLKASVLWMTGSINYIWPMTAGLIAIIPFRDALMDEYDGKFNILYLLAGIFASLGQEQVTILLMTFSTIINILIYTRNKKVYKYLIFQNIVMIIGTLAIILAPGNVNRNHIETNNWLPNYILYSKWEIAFYGIQWFLNNLLNDCRIIFVLLLGVLSIALCKKNKGLISKPSILIPIIGCFIIIIGIVFSLDTSIPKYFISRINFSSSYHSIWNYLDSIFFNFNIPFSIGRRSLIKFFLWPVIIVIVPYFIAYLYDFKIEGLYVGLIYIAGICTAIIMFVSPTIYVSGQRTLFALSTLFFIVFIILIKKSEVLLKKRYIFVFAIFSMLKYIYFIMYLKNL